MASVTKVVNLGSSSEGNAIYIEITLNDLGKTFTILLDCGFQYNTLLRKMTDNRLAIANIDTCLVSHEHQDHCASATTLVERGIPLYAPKSVFDKLNIETDTEFIVKEYEWQKIHDDISIMGLPMEHYDKDEKVYNLGYIIKVANEIRILYVIDTKFLPQDLSTFAFDYIFIEANYLEDKIKFAFNDAVKNNKVGEVARYSRLLNSHMSLENLAKTLTGEIRDGAKPFNLSKCKAIFLTHLSSSWQTNESYYREFLSSYIEQNRAKVKLVGQAKIIICKKEGGFL